MPHALNIHTIVSMPFAENTIVAWLNGRSECIVVDPGLEPHLILEFLSAQELTPDAILNTHGHADHIGGNAVLKETFPDAPLIIGAGDEVMLTDVDANLSGPFGLPVTSPPADQVVVEGDVLELAGIRLEVLEIPGHSPGHVVFVYRGEPHVVFGGDVLFQGSIGRFDFPNGDGKLLIGGIRDKLFSLPSDTIVYPGHGPITTLQEEKQNNPYVGDSAELRLE